MWEAMTACENSGYDKKYHFLGITKRVDLDSGAKRLGSLQTDTGFRSFKK